MARYVREANKRALGVPDRQRATDPGALEEERIPDHSIALAKVAADSEKRHVHGNERPSMFEVEARNDTYHLIPTIRKSTNTRGCSVLLLK
jgi:hypothetical protein